MNTLWVLDNLLSVADSEADRKIVRICSGGNMFGLHDVRRAVAVVAVAALAMVGSAPTALSVNASTPSGSAASTWHPQVADSSQLTGDVVVTGVVRRSDGSRSGGARVSMFAAPDQRGIRVGDSFSLEPVAKAVADDDGTYALRLDPQTPLGKVTTDAGTINLTVLGTDGAYFGVRHLSVSVSDADKGAKKITTTLDTDTGMVDEPAQVDVPLTATDNADPRTTDAATSLGCIKFWDLGRQRTHLGTIFIHPATVGVEGDFTYGEHSSSTLGVGFSATGTSGEWSQSGRYLMGSSSSLGWAWRGSSLAYYTSYTYQKIECVQLPIGRHRFEVRPSAFTADQFGSHPDFPTNLNQENCSFHGVGTDYSHSTSRATEFATGVSLGAVIGIDLSAQSGYSEATTVRFRFDRPAYLCGTEGFPGERPGLLAVKQNVCLTGDEAPVGGREVEIAC